MVGIVPNMTLLLDWSKQDISILELPYVLIILTELFQQILLLPGKHVQYMNFKWSEALYVCLIVLKWNVHDACGFLFYAPKMFLWYQQHIFSLL